VNEPDSNVDVREPMRSAVVSFARKLAVVDALVTVATLLVCWFEGWTSRAEVANATFLAGGLLAGVGALPLAVRWGMPLGPFPVGGDRGTNSTWFAERFIVLEDARGVLAEEQRRANRELPVFAFLVIAGAFLMAGGVAVGTIG